MGVSDFDSIVEEYTLREVLIIDKEYKKQGKNSEKDGILESELKRRVRQRILTEHPELQSDFETIFDSEGY